MESGIAGNQDIVMDADTNCDKGHCEPAGAADMGTDTNAHYRYFGHRSSTQRSVGTFNGDDTRLNREQQAKQHRRRIIEAILGYAGPSGTGRGRRRASGRSESGIAPRALNIGVAPIRIGIEVIIFGLFPTFFWLEKILSFHFWQGIPSFFFRLEYFLLSILGIDRSPDVTELPVRGLA